MVVQRFRFLVDGVILSKSCFKSPLSVRSFSREVQEVEHRTFGPRKKAELTNFLDSIRLHVKGGKGGEGFPKKGGIGGKGGDVIVVGCRDKGYTLKEIEKAGKRYQGKNGDNAKLFCIFGAPGQSVFINAPLGVSIVTDTGIKLGEINEPSDKVVVAQGGEGGGPINGYCGQRGQVHHVTLDLKLIADVGFVGFPNAGKSTLLKGISRAKPRIASFPFTTIRPNVGIIEYNDERTISLADLPGLIEGAHKNMGMGHKFLKHVERTKVLLFVVDIHGFQLSPKHPARTALETIVLLNKELELYQEDLTLKPAILALNKIDKPGSYPLLEEIRDTLYDDEAYEKYINTLPEDHRPVHRVKFDKIVPISALKDVYSVLKLKDAIRKCIDVNHSYNELLKEKFPAY